MLDISEADMGNFTGDTFDKSKHYISVRLQQGVPLVDADWNEQDDIRRYELRGFLRSFVGDGVPAGNDGFQIKLIEGVNDDFLIMGGDGTTDGAGRILVGGWEVLNESDMAYSAQGLEPLIPGDTVQTVYLDIWEREVGPQEDDSLINPDIGEETCVRVKREWLVQVTEDDEILEPAAGHLHYPLARLKWIDGQINIVDLRRTGLVVGSYLDMNQATTDAFGETYTLDHDGQPNLEVSLRDAINAILLGGLPQPDAQCLIRRAFPAGVVKDSAGDIWVFWMTDLGDGYQLRYSRYKLINGKLNEVAQDQVTDKVHWGFSSSEDDEYDPSPNVPFAVADGADGVLVLWPSIATGKEALWWRYHDGSAWTDDGRPVPAPPTPRGKSIESNGYPFAFEGSNDTIWLFWVTAYVVDKDAQQSEVKIAWNRFQNQAWGEPDYVTITDIDKFPLPQDDERPGAYEDRDGNIHLFWAAGSCLMTNIYEKADGDWSWAGQSVVYVPDKDGDIQDIVATKDRQGIPTVIYSVKEQFEGDRVRNIGYAQRNESNGSWLIGYITQTHVEESEPFPVFHSNGKIYVFWHVATEDVVNIRYKRTRNAWTSVNSNWEDAALLPGLPEHNGLPMAIEDDTGNIWVFFADVDVLEYGPDWADIDHWHIGIQKLLMAI